MYCGEWTLCSSRNPHSAAAHTGSSGKLPSRRARSQPMPHASASAVSTASGDTTSVNCWNATSLENRCRTPQYQIEFVVTSASRCPWNSMEAHQPSNPASTNGRFTAATTPPASSGTRNASDSASRTLRPVSPPRLLSAPRELSAPRLLSTNT
ncbi:hypothetical protein GCM10009676_41310 [Prauserella halophila]|uniref:Uncharacterized protein n=1 Tax=Prauserella halophila TaxID=185641 RepID=A0ABP4H9Q6_9PSEU